MASTLNFNQIDYACISDLSYFSDDTIVLYLKRTKASQSSQPMPIFTSKSNLWPLHATCKELIPFITPDTLSRTEPFSMHLRTLNTTYGHLVLPNISHLSRSQRSQMCSVLSYGGCWALIMALISLPKLRHNTNIKQNKFQVSDANHFFFFMLIRFNIFCWCYGLCWWIIEVLNIHKCFSCQRRETCLHYISSWMREFFCLFACLFVCS